MVKSVLYKSKSPLKVISVMIFKKSTLESICVYSKAYSIVFVNRVLYKFKSPLKVIPIVLFTTYLTI